jgi:hypothetical protein
MAAKMANTWNTDQPAVIYLRELIWKYFPVVGVWHDASLSIRYGKYVRDHPAHGVGGRVPRTTAQGGFSRHSEGRAADIYVDIHNAYLKRFGDELFDRLAANAMTLGLEDLIWNTRQWSAKHLTVHPYPKHDHQNHLHVGFSRLASQRRNPLLDSICKLSADIADKAFPV